MPLNSPYVTAWIGLTATFVIVSFFFFFEEITPQEFKICFVSAVHYLSMLQDMIIPELQQCGCLEIITFQQDGAPLHIARKVKKLLRRYFTKDRIISRPQSS